MNFCVLYEIRLLNTGERYIGSTVNYKNRVASHIGRLQRGEHHSIKLQKFFNLYGKAYGYLWEYVK